MSYGPAECAKRLNRGSRIGQDRPRSRIRHRESRIGSRIEDRGESMGDHWNPVMLTLLTYLLYLLTYFTYLPVPKRFFIASRCLKTRESRIRDRGSRIGSRIEDRGSARIEDPAAGIEDGGSRRGSRIGDRDRSRIGSEDPGVRIGDGGSRTQNRGSEWRIEDRGRDRGSRIGMEDRGSGICIGCAAGSARSTLKEVGGFRESRQILVPPYARTSAGSMRMRVC